MIAFRNRYDRSVKWAYATHILEEAPLRESDLTATGRLEHSTAAPRPNDVIVAEVMEIIRHEKIDLASGRRAALFPGDLVGVAYGHRYATRQWQGTIPDRLEPCHLLSAGGVCGRVVDKVADMDDPTTLRPLGYVLNERGARVNLLDYGLRPAVGPPGEPTVILVVGSAMDSGKTTAAFSVVRGLTLSGARVCAAKLTGTAAPKDVHFMADAGALKVLDFTDVGHASTAQCSREQLWNIVTVIGSQLSLLHPDYIVLEIADGVVQTETQMLLEELHAHKYVDYTVYTCNDTLGVQGGVLRLRQYDLNVVAVSGWVACSPLAAQEAQPHTDLPVLHVEELSDPRIATLLARRARGARIKVAGQRPA